MVWAILFSVTAGYVIGVATGEELKDWWSGTTHRVDAWVDRKQEELRKGKD